ncbi:type III secretion system chaperone [Lacisediminimonas sp.]|uniref:type III secretion system chaperone n=1 Tax=Lacisediminimonas sp. TaxID=3060582 RepID=UPI002727256B|nr:type III secretion system chaperone [Lacisediminimonas sp.]MDO8298162.1 type III secretion system chaperone [Lacisediminimonas sp.]
MSISLELAQLLMQELGPQTPEIDAVMQQDDTNWVLMLEDESAVAIEWTGNPSRLVLSANLGHPSEGSQLSVYETLLSYNLLWQDTGGVRMAIDGPQGEVMLIYDLFDDHLTVAELQTVVLNLTSIASIWRDYVKKDSNASSLPPIGSESVHLRA